MTIGNDDWRTPEAEDLISALLALREREELAAFLRDLCTRRELEEMSNRWAIVRLLDRGLTYREIAEQTGVSTATVSRIAQWLHHGTGGYRAALDRLEES